MHSFSHPVSVFSFSFIYYTEKDGSISTITYDGEFISRIKVDTDASIDPDLQQIDEINGEIYFT